jgi:hypothetical protein
MTLELFDGWSNIICKQCTSFVQTVVCSFIRVLHRQQTDSSTCHYTVLSYHLKQLCTQYINYIVHCFSLNRPSSHVAGFPVVHKGSVSSPVNRLLLLQYSARVDCLHKHLPCSIHHNNFPTPLPDLTKLYTDETCSVQITIRRCGLSSYHEKHVREMVNFGKIILKLSTSVVNSLVASRYLSLSCNYLVLSVLSACPKSVWNFIDLILSECNL